MWIEVCWSLNINICINIYFCYEILEGQNQEEGGDQTWSDLEYLKEVCMLIFDNCSQSICLEIFIG